MKFSLLAGVAAIFILAPQAFAQNAAPDAAAKASDQPTIGDIIVTATREKTLLSKTPIALTAITGSSLRDKGRPAGSTDRVALPVSGDKAESRAVVMQLVEQLGFDAIDAGVLDESWRQQPGTPSYCHDLDARALQQALGAAHRDQLPRYRTEADAQAKRIMAERAKLRV